MSPANFALLRAAQTRDLPLLESAIEHGADIHAIQDKDCYGISISMPVEFGAAALNAAIRATEKKELTQDDIEIIKRLLALGVDVNKKLHPDPGSYPLHLAVNSEHEDLIRLLIDYGATVFTSGDECATLLRWAAYKGADWFIRLLLEGIGPSPSNLEVVNGLEQALCDAAQKGHINIVTMLLDFGVNVDARGNYLTFGNTALMNAASAGQAEIVELLRSRGADVWAQGDRGMTVLLSAARGSLNTLAYELLEAYANPNARDFYEHTPLHHAAGQGNGDLARALVARGADLRARNHGSHSILSSAAAGGLNWLIEACLKTGEAVDTEDNWGYTPLMSAASFGHTETMQLLVEHGAQINHVAHYQGETALHYAIYGKQIAAARWLVEQGADLDAEMVDIGHGTLTPLMNAAVSNQIEMMEMIIASGADINAHEAEEGYTALHYAALTGATKAVEVLLRHGSNVNARTTENITPLMAAMNNDTTQIATHLIKHGADVNAKRYWDNTALHDAARYGRDNIVQLLLSSGADWQSLNEKGQTPLNIAEAAGHYRVIKLLQEQNNAA